MVMDDCSACKSKYSSWSCSCSDCASKSHSESKHHSKSHSKSHSKWHSDSDSHSGDSESCGKVECFRNVWTKKCTWECKREKVDCHKAEESKCDDHEEEKHKPCKPDPCHRRRRYNCCPEQYSPQYGGSGVYSYTGRFGSFFGTSAGRVNSCCAPPPRRRCDCGCGDRRHY